MKEIRVIFFSCKASSRNQYCDSIQLCLELYSENKIVNTFKKILQK